METFYGYMQVLKRNPIYDYVNWHDKKTSPLCVGCLLEYIL